MHLEIEKVEENKSIDQDLLKHRVALSEGSRQREATYKKNTISNVFKLLQ